MPPVTRLDFGGHPQGLLFKDQGLGDQANTIEPLSSQGHLLLASRWPQNGYPWFCETTCDEHVQLQDLESVYHPPFPRWHATQPAWLHWSSSVVQALDWCVEFLRTTLLVIGDQHNFPWNTCIIHLDQLSTIMLRQLLWITAYMLYEHNPCGSCNITGATRWL